MPPNANSAITSLPRRIGYGPPVGSHSMAFLASVIDACRLRRANATDLLARAIRAARMGQPAPAFPSMANLDAGLVAA